MTLYKSKNNIHFLVISLASVTIFYYIQKNIINEVSSEHFKHEQKGCQRRNNIELQPDRLMQKNNRPLGQNPNMFCNDSVILNPNISFKSRNQALAGNPNHKTNIPPVVVAPSNNLDFWKVNNLVNHSSTNKNTQRDDYRSGYKVMNSCQGNQDTLQSKIQENFVLQDRGFFPEAQVSDYDRQLYTQTIQPGVYDFNPQNEPIGNIGISDTVQFQPVREINGGETGFTQYDKTVLEPIDNEETVNESNVYDPRFTGYGTSYRAYNDDLLGQPKFFYDDIDAVRMPNYISRSNIDFEKYADSYGPIEAGNEFGNRYNSQIRDKANQSFLNSSLEFRNDMTERMMRKNNAINTQNRLAPKNTGGVFQSGGLFK